MLLIWLRNSLKYDSHTHKMAHKSNLWNELLQSCWIIASQYNISHALVSDSHVLYFIKKNQIISVICLWIILLIPIVWFICYNFWFTCSCFNIWFNEVPESSYTGNAVYLDITKKSSQTSHLFMNHCTAVLLYYCNPIKKHHCLTFTMVHYYTM